MSVQLALAGTPLPPPPPAIERAAVVLARPPLSVAEAQERADRAAAAYETALAEYSACSDAQEATFGRALDRAYRASLSATMALKRARAA